MKRAEEFNLFGPIDSEVRRGVKLKPFASAATGVSTGLFHLAFGFDARFLVKLVATNLAFQSRLFTATLESSQHLVDRFIGADNHFDSSHLNTPFRPFSFPWQCL
jgi:hypothetical protein